jgi:TatD DNase family protein
MREENDSESGDCAADLMAILTDWVGGMRGLKTRLANAPGVMHSFSGALEAAVKAVELGFFVGITGPVTYPSGDKRRHLVGNLPLESILIETDSPFLPPQPHRGRRNEPAFVTYIADKIAQIRSLTPSQVADVTSANAARLFSWGDTV